MDRPELKRIEASELDARIHEFNRTRSDFARIWSERFTPTELEGFLHRHPAEFDRQLQAHDSTRSSM